MRLTLFDLDGTLLPIDSDHAFGEFVVRIGWADAGEHGRRNDAFYRDYQAGCLDMDAYIEFATSAWRGRADDEIARLSERFMAEVIAPAIRPQAHALVERHRAAGDVLHGEVVGADREVRPMLFGRPDRKDQDRIRPQLLGFGAG